jgi:hypothetical protein
MPLGDGANLFKIIITCFTTTEDMTIAISNVHEVCLKTTAASYAMNRLQFGHYPAA